MEKYVAQFVAGLALFATAAMGKTGLIRGTDNGNGGGVVLCKNLDGSTKSIQALDFYEQQSETYGLHLLDTPDKTSPVEKVLFWLNRHSSTAPFRANLWGSWAKEFYEEITFTSIEPEPLHDTGQLLLAEGCSYHQVIVQRPPTAEYNRYTIYAPLWEELDDTNKAGLILHEAIYREALLYHHQDSHEVRKLNVLWTAAEDLEQFKTYRSVNRLLAQSEFLTGEAFGCNPPLTNIKSFTRGARLLPLDLSFIEYFPNGTPKSIQPAYFDSEGVFATPFGALTGNCKAKISFEYDVTSRETYVFSSTAPLRGTLMGRGFSVSLDDSIGNYFHDIVNQNYVLRGSGKISEPEQGPWCSCYDNNNGFFISDKNLEIEGLICEELDDHSKGWR